MWVWACNVCAESVESNSKCKIKKVFENTFLGLGIQIAKKSFCYLDFP